MNKQPTTVFMPECSELVPMSVYIYTNEEHEAAQQALQEHADNKDGLQELEKWVWDNFMGDIPTKILTKISELKKSNTVINEHLELSELKNWVENQIERSPLGVSGSGAYRLAYSEILKKFNDKLKMINKVV